MCSIQLWFDPEVSFILRPSLTCICFIKNYNGKLSQINEKKYSILKIAILKLLRRLLDADFIHSYCCVYIYIYKTNTETHISEKLLAQFLSYS